MRRKKVREMIRKSIFDIKFNLNLKGHLFYYN